MSVGMYVGMQVCVYVGMCVCRYVCMEQCTYEKDWQQWVAELCLYTAEDLC